MTLLRRVVWCAWIGVGACSAGGARPVADLGAPADAALDGSADGSTSGDGGGVDAGDGAELTYPRLASYFIESYVDDASRAVMAKSDIVVVDAESAALDRAPLDALRTARPDALLLAYLTSEEIPRDPTTEQPLAAARFAHIANHEWLLEPGSTLTSDVTATATKLQVADGGAFSVTRPPSDFYDASEPTYLLVDGEHMKLVAVSGKTLTVERGVHSTAVAHTSGTRVASHVVFFGGTWMLDLAANAPAVAGRTWRDEIADEAVSLVASGPWNGLFLDVCFSDISWLNDGLLDLDRDGVADDPAQVSAHWSDGMGALVDTLRTRLGPNVPIISNPGAQDCPHPHLDGILMEGWPIGMPTDYLDYATGEARYTSWARHGRRLTIANGFSPKIGFGTIDPSQDEVARTDFAAMRFGLASALMDDGLYTFDNGVFGHYVAWWYDEYDGAGRGAHWLGRALGDAHVDGDVRWREFEHGLAVVNSGAAAATFSPAAGFSRLAGIQDAVHNDGTAVSGALSIAPSDAYILTR